MNIYTRLWILPAALISLFSISRTAVALPSTITAPNFDEPPAQASPEPKIIEADVSIFFDPQPEVLGTYTARGKSGAWRLEICSPLAKIDSTGNVEQIDISATEWKKWLAKIGPRVINNLANSNAMPQPGVVNVTVQNQKQSSPLQFTPEKEEPKADIVTNAVRSALNLDKLPSLADALPPTATDAEALLLKFRLYNVGHAAR